MELNPVIVYLGCLCAALNLGLHIWRIIEDRKPKAAAYSITSKFPTAR